MIMIINCSLRVCTTDTETCVVAFSFSKFPFFIYLHGTREETILIHMFMETKPDFQLVNEKLQNSVKNLNF